MNRRLIPWFCIGLSALIVSCNRNVTVPPVGPPPVPASPITSTPTRTEMVPPTPTPTGTATGVPVTTTFTWTLTPLPPITWTPTRTFTPLPPITWTPTRTFTPVPTSTWTPNLSTPTATPTRTSTFQFTNPCVDDSWQPYPYGSVFHAEEEPDGVTGQNDTVTTAQNTSAFELGGNMYRGYLSATGGGTANYTGSDRDFYFFHNIYPQYGGTCYIRLDCYTNGSDGRRFDLRLYDSNGVFQRAATLATGSQRLVVAYESTLDLYVEVVGYSGPPGPYRLSFIRETLPTPTLTWTRTATVSPTWTASATPTNTPGGADCPVINCTTSGGLIYASGYPAGNMVSESTTCTSSAGYQGIVIAGDLDSVNDPVDEYTISHSYGRFCVILDGYDDGSGARNFQVTGYHCNSPMPSDRTFSSTYYCNHSVQVIQTGTLQGAENNTTLRVRALSGAGSYRLITLATP